MERLAILSIATINFSPAGAAPVECAIVTVLINASAAWKRWTPTNDQNQPPDDILLQRLVIDVQKLGTRIADRQFAKLTLATLLG